MKLTKHQQKKIALRYLDKLELIQEHDTVDYSETEEDKEKRFKRAKKDYNYFVREFFPHYAQYDCADFHIQTANAILRDIKFKGVLEWFRGAAKSTHSTIFLPIWLMLFHEQMKFMVLLSSTKDNAAGLLSDLQAELTANPQLRHHFGDLSVHGDWSEGEFRSKNGSFFLALGKKGLRRGIRNGPHRPDYIVLDDIDDDVEAQNPARVEKSYKKIIRAIRASMDIGIARFIVVNNRIASFTIMTQFASNPKYKHIKVNALKEDGTPSWAEKYDAAYYEDLREEIGVASFDTEYQNDPTVEGKLWKDEHIQFAKIRRRSSYDRIVGFWDVAYSESKTADFNAIPVVGRYHMQRHIIAAFCQQCKMEDALRWMYEYNLSLPETVIVEWYAESQFWNDAVEIACDLVAKEYEHKCSRLPIIWVDNPKTNKFSRMLQMLPSWQRKEWYCNKDLEHNVMMQTGLNQLKGIEPGYGGKDDFPDALHGADSILNADQVMQDYYPTTGKNTPSSKIY